MIDRYHRNIHYLRISITDRCNLRCQYCMPKGIDLVEHDQIISYEDIIQFVNMMTHLGIDTIKITGGEPLVRKGCPSLIKKLKAIDQIKKVTLTTNGVLLEKYLPELIDAGVDAINVSLDTLDYKKYQLITGYACLDSVLRGIDQALEASIPVKINCVAFKGNDDWKELIQLAQDRKIDVRFIELMPIGLGKKYITMNNEDLLTEIKRDYPHIKKDYRIHGNGPAHYYHIPSWQGSIGFISAIHHCFCEQCNRIRLTSQGYLKCCLCFHQGVNIYDIINEKISEEEKIEKFREIIFNKPKEHCFLNEEDMTEQMMMSSIGG